MADLRTDGRGPTITMTNGDPHILPLNLAISQGRENFGQTEQVHPAPIHRAREGVVPCLRGHGGGLVGFDREEVVVEEQEEAAGAEEGECAVEQAWERADLLMLLVSGADGAMREDWARARDR